MKKKFEVDIYLKECNKIMKIKSVKKRHKRMVALVNKWLKDENMRRKLSDGFIQYVSEVLMDSFDKDYPFNPLIELEKFNVR